MYVHSTMFIRTYMEILYLYNFSPADSLEHLQYSQLAHQVWTLVKRAHQHFRHAGLQQLHVYNMQHTYTLLQCTIYYVHMAHYMVQYQYGSPEVKETSLKRIIISETQ